MKQTKFELQQINNGLATENAALRTKLSELGTIYDIAISEIGNLKTTLQAALRQNKVLMDGQHRPVYQTHNPLIKRAVAAMKRLNPKRNSFTQYEVFAFIRRPQ